MKFIQRWAVEGNACSHLLLHGFFPPRATSLLMRHRYFQERAPLGVDEEDAGAPQRLPLTEQPFSGMPFTTCLLV